MLKTRWVATVASHAEAYNHIVRDPHRRGEKRKGERNEERAGCRGTRRQQKREERREELELTGSWYNLSRRRFAEEIDCFAYKQGIVKRAEFLT